MGDLANNELCSRLGLRGPMEPPSRRHKLSVVTLYNMFYRLLYPVCGMMDNELYSDIDEPDPVDESYFKEITASDAYDAFYAVQAVVSAKETQLHAFCIAHNTHYISLVCMNTRSTSPC